MTIHFFTFSNEKAPSSRQRAFRVSDELRARGYQTILHTPTVLSMSTTHWPKKAALIVQTIRSLFSIKKGDIIFLQRAISNKYFFVIMVVYLSLFRRKMIFDFDDPVYVHSFLKTKIFTQMADAVIVCTHGQATWAKQYNRNVYIIHIALNHKPYEQFTKDYSKEPSPLTIGWVGTGPEHLSNLGILADVFKKMSLQSLASFKFTLIGAVGDKKVYELFQDIPNLNVEFIDALNWTDPHSVPREIQKFDIGVLPHHNEGEWYRSKTSMKVLEYMAGGVATICSAFGEMPYVVEDGVNGFVAQNEEEWIEKLQQLLRDRELRARLGRAGQETVRSRYSFEAIMPAVEAVIKALGGLPWSAAVGQMQKGQL